MVYFVFVEFAEFCRVCLLSLSYISQIIDIKYRFLLLKPNLGGFRGMLSPPPPPPQELMQFNLFFYNCLI